MSLRETVHDRWGNPIYLTEERWDHILEFHEEMAGFRAELLAVLRQGNRRQDALDPSVYIYFLAFGHLPGHNTHIIVVVKFALRTDSEPATANNFVLTAYPKTLYSQR